MSALQKYVQASTRLDVRILVQPPTIFRRNRNKVVLPHNRMQNEGALQRLVVYVQPRGRVVVDIRGQCYICKLVGQEQSLG
jgi:hypothetical protein